MDITRVIKDIANLVEHNQTESKPLNEIFALKCRSFEGVCIESLNVIIERIDVDSPFSNEPIWWRFHTLILHKLIILKDLLAVADEKGSLLSVSQQKTLKAAFELCAVLGIINHLPDGIGISLKQRSITGSRALQQSTDHQKTYSLCLTAQCLMTFRENDTFKEIISRQHLGDLMAALFALLFPPVEFKVPESYRPRAKMYLETLIQNEFQPYVIKELLLLFGNKECNSRVSRALRGFLTDRLMQKVGVVATIKAILDLTHGLSSPQHWKTVTTLSKLLVTPHVKDIEMYKAKVYPQILQLLYCNEEEFMQVATSCVRHIHDKDPISCKKWFLDELTRPLSVPSSEDDVSRCIEGLHNCCGIPCSENWALPISAIGDVHVNLFKLHCKTHLSIYHLKSKVADLVSKIIEQCDPEQTYNNCLFRMGGVVFTFGEHGGIITEIGEENTDWEAASDLLLEMIMQSGSVQIKSNYFQVALNSVTENDLVKKLVSAKLLAELAAEDDVQPAINDNPEHIVSFVTKLLDSEEQIEIACLGLMAISALLDNPKYKKTRNWGAFKALVQPLKEFQSKTTNIEVKLLAEELRSTILSQGVITPTAKPRETKDSRVEKTIDEAMEEAVDKLLPVRAHGLMTLTRLIMKKDKDTFTKRDVLLCLFKENLKEEDSYVYLAAVEGLSALAASYPDDILVTLIEQFNHAKNSELRLKVGESLMKITRLLNEMAVVYKGDLIGAFLLGCQDDDHLVRASSLSNLGEVCKILSFRVHIYLVDIFQLLSSFVQTEKFAEPRRAAVMVITLLLQGLGRDTLSTLQELALELYRSLKTILRTDKDDITKLHAELALQELNASTINFLMPSQNMEKRIFVLDPLPD